MNIITQSNETIKGFINPSKEISTTELVSILESGKYQVKLVDLKNKDGVPTPTLIIVSA